MIYRKFLLVFVAIVCFASSVQAGNLVYARKRLSRSGSDDSIALPIGDHVYVCRYEDSLNKEICMSRTGGNTGGALVNKTSHFYNGIDTCVYKNGAKLGACHVNNDETFFFSPSRNASCHQESNHMLRVKAKNASGKPILAGPIVNPEVLGGSITSGLFGNYGRLGLDTSCLKVCP